jgi:hypothetical protein
MKFFAALLLAASVSAAVVAPRANKKGGKATASTTAAIAAATAATGSTLVLNEVNGVPGNPCLTFRNNGKSYFLCFGIPCLALLRPP